LFHGRVGFSRPDPEAAYEHYAWAAQHGSGEGRVRGGRRRRRRMEEDGGGGRE